jgi:hypothetical protein
MSSFIYKYCITLTVIWFAVIFILCATPGRYIPSVSWLELLSFDKWVHASVFFILASLCYTVAIKKSQSSFMIVIYLLICITYGGLLEIMQAKFFSNRSADWQDFIANSFGALMAMAIVKKIRRVYRSFS